MGRKNAKNSRSQPGLISPPSKASDRNHQTHLVAPEDNIEASQTAEFQQAIAGRLPNRKRKNRHSSPSDLLGADNPHHQIIEGIDGFEESKLSTRPKLSAKTKTTRSHFLQPTDYEGIRKTRLPHPDDQGDNDASLRLASRAQRQRQRESDRTHNRLEERQKMEEALVASVVPSSRTRGVASLVESTVLSPTFGLDEAPLNLEPSNPMSDDMDLDSDGKVEMEG
ncbi:hypothetical protein BJ508DRAFT_314794 [Ascobolus immersus RN42]|uniref:Uncharacterized protein n=1 Tax=Ascobolus immersus RN42 TaxID=1160509 RepID=A0A3N4HJM5_ASCIM|nr:hypothetical protein BJ508DRAFT_314794 [Ascobolus immersus RN42]